MKECTPDKEQCENPFASDTVRCYSQPTAFCGEYVIKGIGAEELCLNPDPKVCERLRRDSNENICFSSLAECDDWCRQRPCISTPMCREFRPEQY